MAAYVHDSQFFTRRSVVLFAIIGLHLLVIWAFASGLAHKAIELVAPLKTEIIEEVQKRDEPPPPPPPQMERPPVEVPPPEVDIQLPVETQSTAIQDVTDKPVPKAPPPPPAPPAPPKKIAAGGPGKGFPNSEDFYPPASKRLGEEGAVTVHVCVGPNGKLTEEPSVSTSSGSARLDEGALKLAKAGSGHYRPSTEDGSPITACYSYKISFQLRN